MPRGKKKTDADAAPKKADAKKAEKAGAKKTGVKLAKKGAPLKTRLRTAAIALVLAVLLLPIVLVLPLRFIDPPTTMVMLSRTIDRWKKDKRPYYPRRKVVELSEIAPVLRHAILAAEDQAFYLHHGFDAKQIERALEEKKDGKKLRGASTISQQTAKNLFLWNGRSFVRKGLEAYLTFWLELLMPKDRILEIYLNLVETGDGVFGVEEAAQRYFKKSAAKLTPTESARIAAILPSPRKWSPFGDYADKRVGELLDRMSTPIPKPK